MPTRPRQHGVPLWDTSVANGLPALGRGEMISNPVYILLRLLLPTGQALSYGAVLCLALGGIFTFGLVREVGANHLGALIGALVFAYNGYFIVWLTSPIMASAMVWLPLVFWGVERAMRRREWRWVLVGWFSYTLQILSGNLLFAFCTAVTLGLYVACRGAFVWRASKDWRAGLFPVALGAVALGGGAALAAPQFLLAIELFFQTTRTARIGALSFMPVTRLIRLLAPAFDGVQLHGGEYAGPHNYSESGLYFGIAPLAFMAASLGSSRRRLAAWMVGATAATVLAVYSVPPFRQIFPFVYPLTLNSFPGRAFVISMLAGSVAAGLGVDWLIRSRPVRFMRPASFACMAAAGLLLALSLWYVRVMGEVPGPQPVLTQRVHSLFVGSVWAALTAAWLWVWGTGRLSRPIAAGLALALVAADLMSAYADYNPGFPRTLAFPLTDSLQFLETLQRQDPQPNRIAPVPTREIFQGMLVEQYPVSTVSAYTSWLAGRFEAYVKLTHEQDSFQPQVYAYFNDCCGPLLDALNVKYVYVAAGTTLSQPTGLKLIYDGPNKVYENTAALPRAWVVHRMVEVPPGDLSAAARQLAAPSFDPAQEAVVEGQLPGALGAAQAGDSVQVISYEPERVEVKAHLAEAGLLVLSDLYYPGWRASVDGHSSPIFATNLAMRGVYLEAGTHTIVFEYKPILFTVGIGVAVAALLAAAVALAWTARERRRGASA
jgi:Bacterial membrane protein YfhO